MALVVACSHTEEALGVATPDRVLGLLDPGLRIRVAGENVLVEAESQDAVARSAASTEPAVPSSESVEEPPVERAVDEFYISIFCCLNDRTGHYCGRTASGITVAPGVVACSLHYPFSTSFIIAGDTSFPNGRSCQDRGGLVTNPNHIDIWFYDCGDQQDPAPGTGWAWLQSVGDYAEVRLTK